MPDNIKSTAVEALSANVLDTRFEDFDRETVGCTKNRILDTIGCAIGGASATGNRGLVDLVKDWGGKKEASIMVYGGKVPVHNAAMVNSILCRSMDFEANTGVVAGRNIGSHFTGTTVPTALALGEAKGVNGKELLTALLVGDDVTNRILLGFDFNLGDGWGGAGIIGIFGATAIAGRLLGLNREQLRNAFGLAVNLAAGSVQVIWDGATAFKLPQGTAAMSGVFSAELAQKGWTGLSDALLSRFGFYTLYTHGCTHPEMLIQDLGKTYYAENCFKPYPSCRATHNAIDATLKLVSEHDINATDIREVTIYCPKRILGVFVAKPFQIRDFPHCDAIFSLQYTCATALLYKSVRLEHFTEKAIRDPQIQELIAKIKLAELTGRRVKGFEVKVKMEDGKEYSAYTDVTSGDPVNKPLSKQKLLEKYWSQVEFSGTITREKADSLLNLVETLEDVDNVARIIELAVTDK